MTRMSICRMVSLIIKVTLLNMYYIVMNKTLNFIAAREMSEPKIGYLLLYMTLF